MEYIVPKGRHRIKGLHFKRYKGEDFIFEGSFSKECWYNINEVPEPGDKNKLFGVSLETFPWFQSISPNNTWSFAPHHRNSLRFAWRPNFQYKGMIDVYTYIYDTGKRIMTPKLFTVSVEDKFMIGVEVSNSNLSTEFKIHVYANNTKYLDEYCFDNMVAPKGYYLFPYFGGNNVSPSSMGITIDIR